MGNPVPYYPVMSRGDRTAPPGRPALLRPALLGLALGAFAVVALAVTQAQERQAARPPTAASAAPAASTDWPQWRGPGSGATAGSGSLPTTWSPTEQLAWRASIGGLGTSSPIVVGDRVIVTSQIGRVPVASGAPQLARDDRTLAGREQAIGGAAGASAPGGADARSEVVLVVEAFHRRDGRRLWQHKTAAVGPFTELHEKHNLATPTPVSDGERIYAWFGTGQIVALDLRRPPSLDPPARRRPTVPSTRNGGTAARRRAIATSSSCCAIVARARC